MPEMSLEQPRRSDTRAADHPALGAKFSTQDLPPAAQFDAYRGYCAPVIDILPGDQAEPCYEASCEMWTLGRLTLRRIRAPGATFVRRAAQIRHDGLDHWVFNLTRVGTQDVLSAGGGLRSDPGEVSVFSLAGAYEARRSSVEWLGLFVPRGACPAIDAAFHHDRHQSLDTPLGRLLGSYLSALADELSVMPPSDLTLAIEATELLLARFAVPRSADPHANEAASDLPRLRRIRDIIDHNLGSGHLQADRLCKLAGVSRSSLYRMFEPYGGVHRYVQRERLRRAHALLADPECTKRISSIANDLCFADAAAFSRSFRQEFGYAPSELRRSVERGASVVADTRGAAPTPGSGAWGMLYRA
jgi:AraC-like DNA-binding protein